MAHKNDDTATRQDVLDVLATGLRGLQERLAKSEAEINQSLAAEALAKGEAPPETAAPAAKKHGQDCPHCLGKTETVGKLSGRKHMLCKKCGVMSSAPLSKEEMDDRHDDSVLPDDETSKVVGSDDGSAGDIEKGKLAKGGVLVMPNSPGIKMRSGVGLPGMTPTKVGGSPSINIGTAPTLRATPAAGAKVPVRKPAADDAPVASPAQAAADLKADKKAAGVGFLSNLISKFKGAGQSTWSDSVGTGSASAGKAIRRAGVRMALSEPSMEKCGETKVVKAESGGIPAAPKAPAAPKPQGVAKTMKKAALAPNDPKRKQDLPSMSGFQSVASNPTAMPQMPGLPKMKKGQSPLKKRMKKGLMTTNHNRTLV